MSDSKAIILPEQANGAVVPVDVDSLIAMVDAFDKFKSKVLKDTDFWVDTREKKRRVKKSGWLKYAVACNLNIEKVEEREIDKEMPPESGNWVTIFHFDYRAIAQTGRYAEGSGSASTSERSESDKMIHDTRSLAQTRAMNRAISNLVGGGEVSAEEAMGKNRRKAKSNQRPVPLIDADEEQVKTILNVNNIPIEDLTIYKYLDKVRINPKPSFPQENFEAYTDAITSLLLAKWSKKEGFWVVSC